MNKTLQFPLAPVVNTSASEQETTISYSRDEDIASVYTCDNTVLTKLSKLAKEYPNEYKVIMIHKIKDDISGYEFEIPKKLISFRAPTTRVMSDEQRQAAAERLRNHRKNAESTDNDDDAK